MTEIQELREELTKLRERVAVLEHVYRPQNTDTSPPGVQPYWVPATMPAYWPGTVTCKGQVGQ